MNKAEVSKRIQEIGIIPVVRANSPAAAALAAAAVAKGGIPIVEITMTVPGAVDLIAELSRSMLEVLVGAGTVLNADSARKCVEAGAQFLVSPGLDVETVQFAAQNNIVM